MQDTPEDSDNEDAKKRNKSHNTHQSLIYYRAKNPTDSSPNQHHHRFVESILKTMANPSYGFPFPADDQSEKTIDPSSPQSKKRKRPKKK